MPKARIVWTVLASISATALLSACEVREEGPPPPPRPAVIIEPGYYYEPEYYDSYRVYHAPVYYYYDGHHYERRDYVPHGYAPRPRPHFEHEGDERGHYER